MTITITHETTTDTTTPLLISPWETQQASGNIVRAMLDGQEPYITLNTAARRTGTLVALYNSESDADEARALLTRAGAFTIDYPERVSIEMRLVVVGDIVVSLDPRNRRYWTVAFDYQEIAP